MNDVKAIAKDLENFKTAVNQGLPYKPLSVKFKWIWTCNLRCGMCNHWREISEPPLDLAFFKSVVKDLAALGCQKIHLSGGEPTLRSDLEDLIAYICEQNIRPTMTTNATRIDRLRAKSLKKAGLRKVNISIDSPDATIHDQIRGRSGAWEKTVAGFQYLRPLLKAGAMRINTVITPLNYLSLVDIPALATELGADRLNLIPVDEHTFEIPRLTKEQILDYNQTVAPKLAEKALKNGLIQKPQDAYPFGTTNLEIEQSLAGFYARNYYDLHPCFAPWTHALIDHLGRVSVCCMTVNQPIIGDLRQQTFKEIWAGEKFAALRQNQQLPQLETCRKCDMFLENNQQVAGLLFPH